MYTLPKFLMFLLNIYFNLLVIHPSLQGLNFQETAKAAFGALSTDVPETINTEVKLELLLTDYKHTLEELSTIQDDAQAIIQMQTAGKVFMDQAQTIAMELEAATKGLSPKEVSRLKEKQLINPIFKQINDASWAYVRTGRLEANVDLKNSFLAMDDFMEVIFK